MTTQKLLAPFRKALLDYKMINDGDRIAIGLSGGKDSLTLLQLFAAYKRFAPEKFELCAVHIDMGLDEIGLAVDENEKNAMADFCYDNKIELIVEKTQTAAIIFRDRKETNPCSLCAKLRRGALNSKCVELGCNKLALGHHKDDLVETFFLSMFYEGRLATFSPQSYMSRTAITLIRPMIYIDEKNISAYAKHLPILNNPCPQNHIGCREYMKNMIKSIQKDIPFAKERIFSAIISPERYNLFDKFVKDIEEIKK